MSSPIHILLQTTIEHAANDWHIGRFSMLCEYLLSLKDKNGDPLFLVTARDRDPIGGADSYIENVVGQGHSRPNSQQLAQERERG